VQLQDIVGTVEFENVSFSYDGTHEVLHDISFRSEPGTVTALVGSSGSGKSTTIGLISAFYVPSKGTIRVDGVDLSTVRLNSYRTRWALCCRNRFCSMGRFARTLPSRGLTPAKKKSCEPAGSRVWTNSPKRSRRSTTRS
jgi:ABC-type cobalamin/Fe3+-siderophores transport system ATPase subunit